MKQTDYSTALRDSSEQILSFLDHTPQRYLPTNIQNAMKDLRMALSFGNMNVERSARMLLHSMDSIENLTMPFRLANYRATLKKTIDSKESLAS